MSREAKIAKPKKADPPLPAILDGLTFRRAMLTPPSPFRLHVQHAALDGELIVVISGVVALYAIDSRSRRIFVGLRFPGEAILPGERGSYGVWALTRSEVAIVDRVDAPDPASDPRFFPFAARNLAIAHKWLSLARYDCPARVAHFLLEIATRGGFGTEEMPLLLTQAQLADLTGQTSVNVNRVIREFARAGLIEQRKRSLVFRDWGELARIANFDPEYLKEASK